MTVRGSSRPCTRFWARPPTPRSARIVVSSDPKLVQGPRVHDLESMRMGDPFFDRALAVRTSNADAAFRLLRGPVRRDLQGLLSARYRPGLVLQVDETEISLTWLGEETRPAVLDEACGALVRACEAACTAGYR